MTAERPAHQTVLGRLLGRVALIEKHEMAAVTAAFLLSSSFGGYFDVRDRQ